MEMPPTTRPASHRWWFRLLILCCFLIPPMTGLSYDPARTTEVVRAVLQEPYAMFIPALLPIAKLLLASAAVLPFLGTRWSGRFVVGYYAAILLVISFLQNMAATEQFGFVWLIGNTVVQLIVASFRLVDVLAGSTTLHRDSLQRRRLWLLVPITLALLMPYSIDAGHVVASVETVLWNEAGVTYCMITPVVLGVLLLFPSGVDRRALAVASFVGLIFGVINMAVWFVSSPQDWWMRVLHIPLVVTAGLGLIDSRYRPAVVNPNLAAAPTSR